MALTIILLICVIILAVMVALEFHAIRVLLEDHDDILEIADETNSDALEVLNQANEMLEHTKEMIALAQEVNDYNRKFEAKLREMEQNHNGKA